MQIKLVWSLLLMLTASQAFGASDAPSNLTPAKMREDLLYVRDKWSAVDKSLGPAQKQRFDELIAESIKKADTLTPSDFALDVLNLDEFALGWT